MFLVNSRYPRFSATSLGSVARGHLTYKRRTFSRSYGANLPSSFTRADSSALGYSPRPPVSVCGTVTRVINLTGAFLGSVESPS